MARMIACGSCRQTLTLPENVSAGQQIKCPACGTIMVVPGLAKPVVLPARPSGVGSTQTVKSIPTDPLAKPLVQQRNAPRKSTTPPVEPAEPSTPKPGKKKKKKQKESTGLGAGAKWMIAGLTLFCITSIVLIMVFVPWGKLFASTPEAEIVDVFTAVNSMGYNNVGVRVMNSDTAAYCIPGPRQIMVARNNPSGKHLLLHLKVPYADVDKFFQGARGRIYLNKGHIQVESNGETKDAVYIQDDNAASGHFQMSYQPPMSDAPAVPLRDYIGPKKDAGTRGWTHEGLIKEYNDDITFEDQNGMQVRISVGSERQDGGGGNVLEHLTGKKILGNQQGLTGSVGGYVHVDWNVNSGGYIVSDDLEQPNEIGTSWKVNCIVELPAGATGEVTLKVLGKSRKVKIK
ncbi:MAG: hypothetical protein QM703_04020 [Gemmatales bacterium]